MDDLKIVGFAHDIVLVVVAKYVDEKETKINDSIATIRSQLESIGLVLAKHKTGVAKKPRSYQQLNLECTP